MTILEALTWGENKIKSTHHEKHHNHHNAKFDAQILLAHILDKPKTFLFTHANDKILNDVFDKYANLITRRANHEPIAYLIGKAGFYGKDFKVNQSVLIPRPETELMIDFARDLAKPNSYLIDVGTGSGILPIIWQIETGRPAIATDIDPQALAVAKYNATKHKIKNIRFYHGDLLTPILKKELNIDHLIITANLPYLPYNRKRLMDPDVRKYEPEHALIAGIDGLDLYDKLLNQIKQNRESLAKQIILLIEIDPEQAENAMNLIKNYSQGKSELYHDLNKKPRLIITQM